jgi:replicative DNA helicase
MDHGKIPPQSIDTEEVLLGALLLESSTVKCQKVLQVIKSEHFYKTENQLVCAAILDLWQQDAPIDIITVTDHLRHTGDIDMAGGPYHIAELTNRVSGSSNVEYWFRSIVYPSFLKREMIKICQQTLQIAYEDTFDTFDQLDKLIAELESCKPSVVFRGSSTAKTISEEFLENFKDDKDPATQLKKYPIGDKMFDEVVTTSADKIVLVAGHKKGLKTRFTHRWVTRLLEMYNDVSVYWVTLEDSAPDQLRIFLSSKIYVTPKMLKYRLFNPALIPEIRKWTAVFQSFDVKFRDQTIKIKELEGLFRTFCSERPGRLCILVIDNVLSLDDRNDYKRDLNAMYDYIYSVILNIRQSTHGLIIPIHHYNEEQMDKSELVNGYRPRMQNLKGTEAAGRTANQILLTLYPRAFKDLLNQYSGQQKEILSHTWILDAAGNRESAEIDELSLIRYLCEPDYALFKEYDQQLIVDDPQEEPIKLFTNTQPF